MRFEIDNPELIWEKDCWTDIKDDVGQSRQGTVAEITGSIDKQLGSDKILGFE
tara:strand:- start:338 stop:496 length:159 start_codon:yes stop_codon:yes gene_type:complete